MNTRSNTKMNEDPPQKWEEKLKDRDHNFIAIMDKKLEERVQKLEEKVIILDKMESLFNIEDHTRNMLMGENVPCNKQGSLPVLQVPTRLKLFCVASPTRLWSCYHAKRFELF